VQGVYGLTGSEEEEKRRKRRDKRRRRRTMGMAFGGSRKRRIRDGRCGDRIG
jgi:hypothetical protein